MSKNTFKSQDNQDEKGKKIVLLNIVKLLLSKLNSVSNKTYSSIKRTKMLLLLTSLLTTFVTFSFAYANYYNNNNKVNQLEQELNDKDDKLRNLNRELKSAITKTKVILIKNSALLHKQNEVIKSLGAPDKMVPIPYRVGIRDLSDQKSSLLWYINISIPSLLLESSPDFNSDTLLKVSLGASPRFIYSTSIIKELKISNSLEIIGGFNTFNFLFSTYNSLFNRSVNTCVNYFPRFTVDFLRYPVFKYNLFAFKTKNQQQSTNIIEVNDINESNEYAVGSSNQDNNQINSFIRRVNDYRFRFSDNHSLDESNSIDINSAINNINNITNDIEAKKNLGRFVLSNVNFGFKLFDLFILSFTF